MPTDTATRRRDITDAPDALLAQRAGDGDVRAFTVLARRHTPTLRVYARRILGSTSDIDDVVQDTLITAWQQLPRLSDPAAVRSWLLRIANRKALDRLRAHKPTTELDDQIEAPASHTPERQLEHQTRSDALDAALSALPEQQRQSWLLHEAAGLSYTQIGDELGVPASTVRGLLARARKQLIAQMEAWR